MDIIELCFINVIQGRRRSRSLAIERGTLKSWPESVEGMFWRRSVVLPVKPASLVSAKAEAVAGSVKIWFHLFCKDQ